MKVNEMFSENSKEMAQRPVMHIRNHGFLGRLPIIHFLDMTSLVQGVNNTYLSIFVPNQIAVIFTILTLNALLSRRKVSKDKAHLPLPQSLAVPWRKSSELLNRLMLIEFKRNF